MTFFYGVVVFFVATLTDWIWARWSMATSSHQAGWGAFWAAGIGLCGLVGWNAYRHSYWCVIPMTAGFASGTYLSVRHKARHQPPKA